MKITVRYFAMLKEFAQQSEETIDLAEPISAEQLYRSLSDKYHFPLAVSEVRVAVDDEFTSLAHMLRGQETVVFIPPVAGG